MKKTWLILSLVALLLLGCLLLSAMAWSDPENDNAPDTTPAVSSTDDGAAESDGNGTPSGDDDGTPSDDDDDNQQGEISDGGANTEGGWGPIHPVG